MAMNTQNEYVHMEDKKSGHKCYLHIERVTSGNHGMATINTNTPNTLNSVSRTPAALKDEATYVYRKITVAEFEQMIQEQKVLYPLVNHPVQGEKWLTEGLHHTREFKKNQPGYFVCEVKVNKPGYLNIRNEAIPQAHSKAAQAGRRVPLNITNTELLKEFPSKHNLCLKGNINVDAFNKHVLNVKEIDPNSWINKNNICKWIRRNKLQATLVAVGIVIDVTCITLSVIKDDGTFGEHTQITIGQMTGGYLGATIGAAMGTILPGVGTIVLGFIGAVIGSLIGKGLVKLGRYLFCATPVAPGPGPPKLDTDPTDVFKGIPQSDFCNCDSFGAPNTGLELNVVGAPSLGLDNCVMGAPPV